LQTLEMNTVPTSAIGFHPVAAHRTGRRRLMMVLLLCGMPLVAQAHIAGGEAGGFVGGFKHPVSGWDHILAMVAVGVWGAQMGGRAVWLLPVMFPLVMACGGFLGLIGVPIPGIETGIAVSAVVLGAMVLFECKPPMWVCLSLVSAFAIFHGHAHGAELPAGANAALYSIGFVIATGCLHGVGIALGLVHKWRAGQFFLRGAGAVICLGGCFFLWKTLP
jgi:urease accessory protein